MLARGGGEQDRMCVVMPGWLLVCQGRVMQEGWFCGGGVERRLYTQKEGWRICVFAATWFLFMLALVADPTPHIISGK